MRDIYLPNLLRVENFKEVMNAEAQIPYFMDFDLNDNTNFSVMLRLAISNILENYVIFDKVYIDLLEFPIILKELSKIDIQATKKLLASNSFSYISIEDLRVGVKKNEKNFNLIAFKIIANPPKTIEELENFLFSFFNKNDAIDLKNMYELKPYISNIYNSKKSTIATISAEELVKTIDSELKKGNFKAIGIGGFNTYYITDKNKEIYNAICRLIRNEFITSKLDIFTYYTEDILEEISKIRYDKYFKYDEDFQKISELNKIPDLRKLFLEGRLTFEDIIELKKQKSLKSFQNWFFRNSNKENEIEQEFILLLKEKLNGNLPLKIFRFFITNAVGLIPKVGTILGFAAGAIDSFALDSIIEQHSTISFFDNYKKVISEEIPNIENLTEVKVPVKSVIQIDNTVITQDNECDEIIQKLNYMESQIDFSNIAFTRSLAENAKKIAGKKWTINVVMERFMHFNHILTTEFTPLTINSVLMSQQLYRILKSQKGFEFVEDYYFEGYFNLNSYLNKNGLSKNENIFFIDTNKDINFKYKEYLKKREK